ncbi:MAG: ABC transporter substrate-binding protein [Clostridia bacterium]|nr:ABC transporter substrate-binding protein [Clostridia bacterium]
MKRVFCIVLSVCLLVCLTACGAKKAADGKTPITVCLDWTPNTNHTGLYVALVNGYYADAGLDVTIVQPPENGATQACAAGQAQFAVDMQDTLAPAFTSDTPLGVTAVAALVQHNSSGILSKAGQGMDTPAGLAGNTYLTWDSPTELAMLKNVVTNAGADWESVKLIPNTVTNEAQDVLQHPDHAIWVFYGWSGINAEISGVDTDFFYFRDLNPVFDYYTPVLIANNVFLQSEPEAAKAFLAATKQGYLFAAEHPQEAARILIDADDTHSLTDSEALVLASQEYLSAEYVSDAPYWGYISPERWDAFYAWLSEEGLVEKALPAGTGFSNAYLAQ